MKICTKCKLEKVETEFNFKIKDKGIRQWVCRECHTQYLRDHYKKNPATYINSTKKTKKKLLEFVKEAKNLPCKDCGVKYPYYVMDFDHRDSNDKKFSISQHNRIGSFEKIKNEIAKCDVVCANCHRERTFGRITIKDDGTVF